MGCTIDVAPWFNQDNTINVYQLSSFSPQANKHLLGIDMHIVPVVPHEAVAEVSRRGKL